MKLNFHADDYIGSMMSESKVWFTADVHFNHRLAATMRGFESVKDMNEVLVENWNKRVGKGDRVYCLGDMSLKRVGTAELLDQLNGQIYLIRGNHEAVAETKECRDRFVWIKDVFMLKVACDHEKFSWKGKVRIWLSHYAHRSWPNSHHGSLHLFGHSHGYLQDDNRVLALDVGIDAIALRSPVSFEWVIRRMEHSKIWVPPKDRRDELPAWERHPRKWGEDDDEAR